MKRGWRQKGYGSAARDVGVLERIGNESKKAAGNAMVLQERI